MTDIGSVQQHRVRLAGPALGHRQKGERDQSDVPTIRASAKREDAMQGTMCVLPTKGG